MHRPHHQGGSVGNTPTTGKPTTPAYQAPIPWEEFEAPPCIPVCRAASGSTQAGATLIGAGGQTPHDMKEPNLFQVGDNTCSGEGEITTQDNTEPSNTNWMHNFDTTTAPASGADGTLRGAPTSEEPNKELDEVQDAEHICLNNRVHPPKPLHDCLGNPSSRCFANAPWRAFTWTCALLQETHTEPWGTLHATVQESLELAEAVDIQDLPGLQRLWKKRDLNVQGDANHFVNTLWHLSQSRAFHYRYAEIKPGGYLADHVQLPLLVDYPDDWPENTMLQTLMNGWANEGLGHTSWMTSPSWLHQEYHHRRSCFQAQENPESIWDLHCTQITGRICKSLN